MVTAVTLLLLLGVKHSRMCRVMQFNKINFKSSAFETKLLLVARHNQIVLQTKCWSLEVEHAVLILAKGVISATVAVA